MKSFPPYVSQRSRPAGSTALLISCVVAWMSGAVAITAKSTAAHTLPPTQQFDDVEFDASQPRVTLFNLIANWVVLSVKVNGRDYRMLLDSGAPNVISTSAAASLGLDVEGRYAGWGVGKREITGGETIVSRLRIGNVVLHDQTFHVVTLPYALIHGFSPGIEGIIGYEVFQSAAPTRHCWSF